MKDDVISRAAALDALAKAMPSLTTPDGCGEFDHDIQVTDEAFVDCMRIIQELPSAQPVWIPLAVKYPETNEDVLLQFPSNQGVGFYENGSWGINTGDGIYSAIGDGEEMPMAWMPLPKPWEGEHHD